MSSLFMTPLQQARRFKLDSLKYRFPAEEIELQELHAMWALTSQQLSEDEFCELCAEAIRINEDELEERKIHERRRCTLETRRWQLNPSEETEYKSLREEWIAKTQEESARNKMIFEIEQAEEKRLLQLRRDALETKESRSDEEEAELFLMRENEAHHMAYENGYFPQDVSLYSESYNRLSLCGSTINSRRWRVEQEYRAAAKMGSVHIIKTGSCRNGSWVSYVLMRVPTPERWINFSLHYTDNHNLFQMIRDYIEQNNIPIELQYVETPDVPIAWVQLQPVVGEGEATWAVGGKTTLTCAPTL